MKKIVAFVLVILMAAFVFAACGTTPPAESEVPASEAPAPASEAPAPDASEPVESVGSGPVEIPVIIKATDSDFWQYVWVGAKNYAIEHPDEVTVTLYGPKSEADIEEQVSILENVLAKNPPAIVISSTSSDATVPAFEEAFANGTKIVTIDNKVNTDSVSTFLATDNLAAGGLAAEQFVKALTDKGVELKGKVSVISAMAGVAVLTQRDEGFINKLKELAPDIEVLETKYTDNDIVKAMDTAKDLMAANPDLLGFFADNNHTGDGVARALIEESADLVAVAFDSDPEEISALSDGVLYALILQDPYGMGYNGVASALKALAGEELPAYVDTGATAVTKDNMNNDDIKGLLDPFSKKVAGETY